MNKETVLDILERVKNNSLSTEDAVLLLKKSPFTDIGFAKIDNHRELRTGAAEVIYGAGKTPDQIVKIVETMQKAGQERVLITRLSASAASSVSKETALTYYESGRIGMIGGCAPASGGTIVVAAGGTSDMPVAEEAALTAEFFGNRVTRLYDVGVAGLDRLLSYLDDIMTARVIVAVAGMEGALTSVIGGLASCPVIGVPTSVGYGASFHGLSALLSMLNSCASGVSVVNIDNGYGAGYLANIINHPER